MGAPELAGRTDEVTIATRGVELAGTLTLPAMPRGIVLFAHGSGSSRLSPRNRYVAGRLNEAGVATLLFDLLTATEEQVDLRTRHLRFDIGLLAERLAGATGWVARQRELAGLPVGYFGASTGGGAALVAAAEAGDTVAAVVSRGGRPDLAGEALCRVHCPTLLIVGGGDEPVIEMNREALAQMSAPAQLRVVPRATHLFEEPGTLEQVADLASAWFVRHFTGLGLQATTEDSKAT